jgi:hypothetical protein
VDQGPLREDLYARVFYADIDDRNVVPRLYFRRPEWSFATTKRAHVRAASCGDARTRYARRIKRTS